MKGRLLIPKQKDLGVEPDSTGSLPRRGECCRAQGACSQDMWVEPGLLPRFPSLDKKLPRGSQSQGKPQSPNDNRHQLHSFQRSIPTVCRNLALCPRTAAMREKVDRS